MVAEMNFALTCPPVFAGLLESVGHKHKPPHHTVSSGSYHTSTRSLHRSTQLDSVTYCEKCIMRNCLKTRQTNRS